MDVTFLNKIVERINDTVVTWKYFFFLAMLLSRASFYSMDYVYQYTPGSLSDSWSINFTIYTEEVGGVILQIFDSHKNQFGMRATRLSNVTRVRINYNRMHRVALMQAPNKCRSCDVTKMTCEVRLRNGILVVRINRVVISDINVKQLGPKHEDSDVNMYAFPKTMTNKRGTLYIMMGNIGPYLGNDDVMVYSLRDQLEGCVDKFTYDDSQISFKEYGIKLRSSCSHKCRDNICNGGLCQEQSNLTVLCDCATTELNGMFCDRGLKNYVPGGNNSFEKVKEAGEVRLKLTWEYFKHNVYCLIDIVSGYKHATISINKGHLVLNSVNISDISINEATFVIVMIANNLLMVKTRRGEYKMNFSIDASVKINVGFSERSNTCETFEGTYDLHFSPSQLRLAQYSTKLPINELTSKSGVDTAQSNTGLSEGFRLNTFVMISSLALALMIVVIILCIINISMTFRKMKTTRTGNFYEEETIEPNVDRVVNYTNIDSVSYCNLDCDYAYVMTDEEAEDADEYMLPKIHLIEDELPPLPPRI